ncbi:M20/M25/M40 family metallo-hydrolase [Aestuariibacter salexigens]|uniref:M20/M25/M40 family metallo-hydrolase n=1 Tax=Aestuariibacter salexigens TaxID=226010 RepID=UPI0003FF3F28|nr:M20/M25/M40 family metallo-hydrolase [Aestuariibacter salexigens]
MRRLLITLSALFLLAGCASTDETNPLERLIQSSEQSDQAYEIVTSLTTEVGPRIPGSEADKRAVAWAESLFKSLQFDKVYKQPVRVRNWSRGLADARVIAPFPQQLVITALGGSVATQPGGLEASVVMFESLEELQQAKAEQVKDRIVFINKRMQRDRAGRGYGPVVIGRARGAIEAAKLGAHAVLIRSVGTSNSRFAHTGAMRYDDSVERIPAGALSNADADNLERMINDGHDVRLFVDMRAKEHGWQTSYNVIGEITGTEKPDEVVLIGAHLDSWDEGTGALDDGAGVGIVVAAANLLKQTTGAPKRTLRVVLYAAEEIGLVGAREYARANESDLANIVVAAESDFGAGRIYQIDTRFAPDALAEATTLFDALAPLGIVKGNNEASGGPDISMLPAKGVPVVSLRQDGTYYFDYHHTPNDTLDKIDIDAIRQNQTAYAIFSYLMANGDIDPRPAPQLGSAR